MTQDLTTEALRKDFLAVLVKEADQAFFSPGLINLIGEHRLQPSAQRLLLWGLMGLASVTDQVLHSSYSANFERQRAL